MNSTDTISGVERVRVNEPFSGFDPDGRRYWTRTIVCHGGGQTRTIVLHADAEGALQLQFHPADLDTCLAGLSDAQLDDLIAAARTERLARDPAPDACPNCGCTESADPLPGTVGRRCVRCCNVEPRDCDGGLAAEVMAASDTLLKPDTRRRCDQCGDLAPDAPEADDGRVYCAACLAVPANLPPF